VCIGYFLLSTYTTVRLVDHCFFPPSPALGRNIHDLFLAAPSGTSCPAFLEEPGRLGSWFGFVSTGRTQGSDDYRVLFATENGTILSESDTALTGTEFPYRAFPGSSPSQWEIHIWRMNNSRSGRLWLVRGRSACVFGPKFQFQPFTISDPQVLSPNVDSQVLLQ
jgi:hypothetical protein